MKAKTIQLDKQHDWTKYISNEHYVVAEKTVAQLTNNNSLHILEEFYHIWINADPDKAPQHINGERTFYYIMQNKNISIEQDDHKTARYILSFNNERRLRLTDKQYNLYTLPLGSSNEIHYSNNSL